MRAGKASVRQRSIQEQVAAADKKRPKEDAKGAMQAFPRQHQSKPGHEHHLDPPAFYDAPFYRGSGKLENKIVLITGGDGRRARAS
jgi:hypothetical protein